MCRDRITVLDPMPRRGVGQALFEALAAVARADGVHELSFEALVDNEAVMNLICEIEISSLGVGWDERTEDPGVIPCDDHQDDAMFAVVEEVPKSPTVGSGTSQSTFSSSRSREAEFTQ